MNQSVNQSAKRWILTSAIASMALLSSTTAAFAVSAPTGAASFTGTSVITAKALTSHGCNDTEWHFVITQTTDAQAPAAVTVSWSSGQTAIVFLDKVTGGTAHYATTANLNSTVTGATAVIDGAWSGQFNLSHGPCAAAATTSDPNASLVPSTSPIASPSTSPIASPSTSPIVSVMAAATPSLVAAATPTASPSANATTTATAATETTPATAILGQQQAPAQTTAQLAAPVQTRPAAVQAATQQAAVQAPVNRLPSSSTDAPRQPLAPILAGLFALLAGAGTLRFARGR